GCFRATGNRSHCHLDGRNYPRARVLPDHWPFQNQIKGIVGATPRAARRRLHLYRGSLAHSNPAIRWLSVALAVECQSTKSLPRLPLRGRVVLEVDVAITTSGSSQAICRSSWSRQELRAAFERATSTCRRFHRRSPHSIFTETGPEQAQQMELNL